ncbi:MAG: MotA/TolQ/ExbB proton channel family protein [Verrucomicrobiota bacterium]
MKHAKNLIAATVALVLSTHVLHAQSANELAAEMKGLVDSGLQEYRELQAEISAAKTPLIREMTELEAANAKLSQEVDIHRAIVAEGKSEIERLSRDLQSLGSQNDFIKRSLDEFTEKFESRIHLSETQRYFEEIQTLRDASRSDAASLVDIYDNQLQVIELSLSHIEEVIGGHVFEGKAIDLEGQVRNGKVAVLGPTGYFVDNNNQFAGMLRFHGGTIEPEVAGVSPEKVPGLVDLVTQNQGAVPYDPTLGDDVAIEETKTTLIEHIQQGGYVGYSILLLGSIAAIISLIKLLDLNRFSVTTPTKMQELAHTAREGNLDKALEDASGISGVVGEMIEAGLRNVKRNAVLLEETMLSVVLKKQPEMERFLPFLAITAAAAPLLGLLGTVVGLIKTFALITVYGAGTPKALSSGISEALITTELGLVIAIPTLILHGLFSRLVKTRLGMLEQIAFDFVKAVSVDKDEAKEA